MSRSDPEREVGAVLAAVLLLGAVLAILAATATNRTVALVRTADASAAREQALLAAESVILATIDRLERDGTGWTEPDGPDPVALGHAWRALDAALLGMPAPPRDGAPNVRLELARDGTGGAIRIRAEAAVRGQRRAVEATVRPASVADLGWAAQFAVVDPAVTGGSSSGCGVPRWAVPLVAEGDAPVEPEVAAESAGAACVRTRLEPGLSVVGPVHLDDTPRIDVAWEHQGRLTTAATAPTGGPARATLSVSDVASSEGALALAVAPALGLPDVPASAAGSEATCRLRGPTLLRMLGPTVRIRSPLSHPRHDVEGGPVVGCPGLDRDELDSVVAVDLPDPVVLEVLRAAGARCAVHPLGIDPGEDTVAEQRCSAGTAYVWGETSRSRTVIAEDDVQIVWDIGPVDGVGSTARIGLVAGGSVVLRRPIGPPLRVVAPFGTDLPFAGPGIAPFGDHPLDAPTATPSRWTEPRISAVLAAVGGSVRVQNPAAGQASDVPIIVVGAVVQRFVGPTRSERRDATGALQARTGRPLHVVHDRALVDAVPPALPRIRGGELRILSWDEVVPEAIAAAG